MDVLIFQIDKEVRLRYFFEVRTDDVYAIKRSPIEPGER